MEYRAHFKRMLQHKFKSDYGLRLALTNDGASFMRYCFGLFGIVLAFSIGCARGPSYIYGFERDGSHDRFVLDSASGWLKVSRWKDKIITAGKAEFVGGGIGPRSALRFGPNCYPVGYGSKRVSPILIVAKNSQLLFVENDVLLFDDAGNFRKIDIANKVSDIASGALCGGRVVVFDCGDRDIRRPPSIIVIDVDTGRVIAEKALPHGDSQPIRMLSSGKMAYWVGTRGQEIYQFDCSNYSIERVMSGNRIGIAALSDGIYSIRNGAIVDRLCGW